MASNHPRRSLLRAGAASALGLSGLGSIATGSAAGRDAAQVDDVVQVPPLDVSDVDLQTEPASASSLPESADGIRPGSMLFVERDGDVSGCTANFVWRDETNGALYLGAAGHCFLQDAPADDAVARPGVDGDDVSDVSVSVCVECEFGGATALTLLEGETVELGDVVYARQEEPGGGEGVGHDFGLVRIPDDAEHLVDPSVPQWGGPDGVRSDAVPDGEVVHQYGAGVLNGETTLTKGSTGVSLGDQGTPESWFAALRASPGDSGSLLVESGGGLLGVGGGAAAGVLTHITPNGTAGTTMERCTEMVADDGLELDLEVVEPGEL